MEHLAGIDPWIALGVVAAMAFTDAVCVLFTSSVVHRRDLAAANWSALSYMLSAFAVISFTNNWIYVVFAALGSWIGAYATMKYLRLIGARRPGRQSSVWPCQRRRRAGKRFSLGLQPPAVACRDLPIPTRASPLRSAGARVARRQICRTT